MGMGRLQLSHGDVRETTNPGDFLHNEQRDNLFSSWSTILNVSEGSGIYFMIVGDMNTEIQETVNSLNGVKERIAYLKDNGFLLKYAEYRNETFHYNLLKVDSRFPAVYLPDKMCHLSTDISRQGLEPVLVSPGKSVDGRLILDLLVNAYQDTFDVAVIASGDRDYVKAVQAVQQRGKMVRIVSFQSNLGPGLSSVVKKEDILLLDQHVTEFVSKTFVYKCSECGTEFTLPFKLYPNP